MFFRCFSVNLTTFQCLPYPACGAASCPRQEEDKEESHFLALPRPPIEKELDVGVDVFPQCELGVSEVKDQGGGGVDASLTGQKRSITLVCKKSCCVFIVFMACEHEAGRSLHVA